MVGPQQSGKSSYIKYLDDTALNVQVKGLNNLYYTVAMDLASLKLNGFDVFLFGTPGLLRFRVMRELVCNGADGFIFVYDAVHPEKDEDAISILNSVRKQNVPIIYLANKQDLDDARSPEIIKSQNNLPYDCKIFPTSTKTGLNIKESINYLVNEVYEGYKEIIQVLQKYENNIKGLAEKLNKNKDQMRDFLNSLEIKRFIEIDRINKTYHVKKGLKNLSM